MNDRQHEPPFPSPEPTHAPPKPQDYASEHARGTLEARVKAYVWNEDLRRDILAALSGLREALRELLDVAEQEVARKERSQTGGAEYWAEQETGLSMPGVDRRIMLARSVLKARAALAVPSSRGQAHKALDELAALASAPDAAGEWSAEAEAWWDTYFREQGWLNPTDPDFAEIASGLLAP